MAERQREGQAEGRCGVERAGEGLTSARGKGAGGTVLLGLELTVMKEGRSAEPLRWARPPSDGAGSAC